MSYLGQMLLEMGVIDEPQLHAALEQQRHSGTLLGQILRANGNLSEAALELALALQRQRQARAMRPGLACVKVAELLQHCAQRRWVIALSAGIGLLAGVMSFPIIFYFYSGWAWNLIGVSANFGAVRHISFACLWLVMLALALEALASYISIHAGADLLHALAHQIHQHALQRRLVLAQPQQPLASLYSQNIEQCVLHLKAFLVQFPKAVGGLCVFFLIIAFSNAGIALLTGVLAAATLVLPPWVAARAQRHVQKEVRLMGTAMQAIAPFYHFFRTTGGVMQARAVQQVARLIAPHHINQAAKWFYWNSSFNLKTLLNLLTLSAILIYGGWQVLHGSLSLAQLFRLFLAISLILPRFNDIYEAHFHLITAGHHAALLLPYLRQSERASADRVLLAPQATLRLQLAQFGFAHSPVLPALDLQFSTGQLTLITGPSGCGKTTLAHILAGMLPEAEASVQLDGGSALPAGALLGHVAYIGQELVFFEQMSALQNAAYEMTPALAVRQQISAAAQRFDLPQTDRLADATLSVNQHYSGGEKQRLHLLQGLFAPQKIRIFDEPTAALDTVRAQMVKQMLSEVPADEIRIVITHDATWPQLAGPANAQAGQALPADSFIQHIQLMPVTL
jgi:ABC-type bacteriocin/lantibiotic exporter with double-glycine peptidase domain